MGQKSVKSSVFSLLSRHYLGDSRINVGNQGMHSHGHDWALIANISEWKWEESK